MRKIICRTIPHHQQRYPTVGDYFFKPHRKRGSGKSEDELNFRISDMGNSDYEFLVFIHELVEQYLTEKRGISEQAITAFDVEFEKNRPAGNIDEPGDDPRAPYNKEHEVATFVEQCVAVELEVDWTEYTKAVEGL